MRGRGSYLVELVVFFSGAVVMVLELVGSRVMAPFVGNSLYAWTALIGVILASLSAGYAIGGRWADKNPTKKSLAQILAFAALAICISIVLRQGIFDLLRRFFDIRVRASVSALFLFGPSSFFLGMVTPYAVKLRLTALGSSGETVGTLAALSTAGSILGTFCGGFFLIPHLTLTSILGGSAVLLFVLSLLLSPHLLIHAIFVVLLVLAFLTPSIFPPPKNILYETDTPYVHVRLSRGFDGATHRPALYLSEEPYVVQGAIFEDKDNDLVFQNLKLFRLADYIISDLHHALMIGGGTYSFPREFLSKAGRTMDVVELDPAITDIAKEYFHLDPNLPGLHIYLEDGRTFLERASTTYDAVFVDVFSSFYPPAHLTTKEAIQKMKNLLSSRGAVFVNLLGAFTRDHGKFLEAEYATYASIFPNVYLFRVDDLPDSQLQNIILIATEKAIDFAHAPEEYKEYLSKLYKDPLPETLPPLRDEYAPVEYYSLPLIQSL